MDATRKLLPWNFGYILCEQVRFELPLHAPRNWCNRTVYMFAVVQLFACYAFVVASLFFLVVAVACRRLSRLVYGWSSNSPAAVVASLSTSNGNV